MLLRRAAKGKRTPALERRPKLFDDLQPAWRAYAQLHHQRAIDGFGGPQPLAVVNIKAWLDLHEYSGDDAIDMLDLLLEMDASYRGWLDRQSKSKDEEKK